MSCSHIHVPRCLIPFARQQDQQWSARALAAVETTVERKNSGAQYIVLLYKTLCWNIWNRSCPEGLQRTSAPWPSRPYISRNHCYSGGGCTHINNYYNTTGISNSQPWQQLCYSYATAIPQREELLLLCFLCCTARGLVYCLLCPNDDARACAAQFAATK